MPPIQNTFSIIPDLPSAINANRYGNGDGTGARPSRPPMTTKQVKKAYQKANKGPKLSKAERRRQELFEQDRIRKEFEKEKNQARARAAREKKKEKEERERAEKKKKGLPLVDVRASQDTIARFVRAKPKSQRNRCASPLPVGEVHEDESECRSVSPTYDDLRGSGQIRCDDTLGNKENVRPPEQFEKGFPLPCVVKADNGHELIDESLVVAPTEPPNKKRRIDVLDEKEEEDEIPFIIANGVASSPLKPNLKVSIAGDRVEGIPCPDAEQDEINTDDSFSTIDFSEEDLLDDLLRGVECSHGTPNAHHNRTSGLQQGQNPPVESPPPQPSTYENHVPSPKESPPCLERTAMPTELWLPPHRATTQSETIIDTARLPRQDATPEQAKQVSMPHSIITSPASGAQKSQSIAPSSRSFCHPRTPMAPPPVPPKFKPSKVSTSHPTPPHFLKATPPPPRTPSGASRYSRMTEPKHARENQLPPSTQLFILSHFDDLLPSPSQEAWEIFEEPKGKQSRNRYQAEAMTRHTSPKNLRSDSHISKLPTTPYNRSMNSTPAVNSGEPRHIQQTANHIEPRRVQPTIQPIPPNTACTFEMPFFSTQDLFLSSQDVKDIEEDPLPPPKAQPSVKPPDPAPSYSKQYFTSSGHETQFKYITERNRTAVWEGHSTQRKAQKELDRLQTVEDSWLQVLLADSNEEVEETGGIITVENDTVKSEAARKQSPIMRLDKTPTPRVQPSRLISLGSSDRSAQNLTPSSGPVSENTAHIHTRKLPDAQQSTLGSSRHGKSQRNTRPKSSYETMLELLAKGPSSQQKQASSALNKDRGDGVGYAVKPRTTEESHLMATTISASQETDYDCGEEWDDDLLRDIL
ncbi:hypothetical protein EKO27_g4902 [Xylaria grammica]|uniref:Uncharacterized protein n=1 Tax=Xylaria grammica TaxID=363999 RepID=A0A439D748_9PEZI|nr:hypothetical protein EKO27_g4902 [Xylaria grammica]